MWNAAFALDLIEQSILVFTATLSMVWIDIIIQEFYSTKYLLSALLILIYFYFCILRNVNRSKRNFNPYLN